MFLFIREAYHSHFKISWKRSHGLEKNSVHNHISQQNKKIISVTVAVPLICDSLTRNIFFVTSRSVQLSIQVVHLIETCEVHSHQIKNIKFGLK